MAISEAEKAAVAAKYTNYDGRQFGKFLSRCLGSSRPEFGYFQSALTQAIIDYFSFVFRYRQLYGFGMTGSIYVPPSSYVPVVGPVGGMTGSTACISSAVSEPVTQSAVTKACKDQTIGFWGRIFELMGKYFTSHTVVLSNPSAMGFMYTTSLRSVYPYLPQQWLLAGQVFEKKIKTKQVDDMDYLYMRWSEEIERLIRTTTSILSVPSWPVAGGIFSGFVTVSWADFNLNRT